ncbi:MAG: biotin transporter BioY [Candidatus Marinimicrobia bacterium]|nr:biotin transporter BioY [Candidatus Neomarinimicrobiota bacterium]MCF7827895.1 biotin transporter BioY [Candidatus Neomarinimicrobiota bacterium]MCF7879350.1 biotin transporter BioY [Candidatus Neomarinimicrobiota bacterium]
MTYSDILRPAVKRQALVYDFSLVIGGSLLLALLAQVQVVLPFSPVPITGQTLGVLLVGALLGRWRGTMAVFAYILEGVGGLPVFAGAAAGPAVLVGPTGGYIMGFLAAAYVTGYLAERGWDRKTWSAFSMMTIGTSIIFISGVAWLVHLVPEGQLLNMGVIPFLPGALIKISLATLLLPAGWKFLGKDSGKE